MRTFTVNGVVYTAKPFDFNLVCDLEDMGVSLEEAGTKPMSMVRAYFALCAGRGKDYAGAEMEQHIINGGKFEEVISVMSAEMDESDFFRSLTQTTKKKTTTKKNAQAQ